MKSENSILLVINPIAGDTDKNHIVQTVKEKLDKKEYQLHIYETTGKRDKEEINRLIDAEKPSSLWIAGGDGTVQMVSECVFDKDIPIAIIPSGSANGLAVNFGIPTNVDEQVELALNGEILKMDVIFIDDKPCLHISDLGMNAELVKNYENSGIRGKLGYFLQTVPTILNSDFPYEFRIETDEGTVQESGILLAIANANKFGTGATINPNGKINDGKFEILIFKKLDLIEILKTVQQDPELSNEFVRVISTDNATIKNSSLIPFQIDGEYIGEVKAVKVRIKKEFLSVIVPQDFIKNI